ncbi:MAG TPA: glutamate-1-semialdehyde 2,1-aminomutase [Pyrinomonadaceae bacterium]|nr:glutamate-1-semialdehyde 2,1-aminomutase [Pyrinomonadaceae bacterium]
MNTNKSEKLFAEARKHLPGGVNSPVRAFKSVGRNPLYIKKAKGAKMTDVDGNDFIDYIGSWGPMILGHAKREVIKAVKKAANDGTSFGANNEQEIKLAQMIKKFVPSIEIVRMVNSGTEATMSAMRLARAFTGRNKIIKFEGCYHGHGDAFLIKAGSGVATLGLPDSPGVTEATAKDTLTAIYNDIESVYRLVEENKDAVAAIFIEPVAGNMGLVEADADFLQALRELCANEKILLIFDEVMTGFRLSRGGAQELYNIKPDLTAFGKIIGGGLPVGAYGGRREIMEMIAPSGAVYQAGTLSGNPLAMTAGLETLKIIDEDKDFYKKLNSNCEYLYEGLRESARKLKRDVAFNSRGSMFTMFFTDQPVTDFTSAKTSDTKLFARYFGSMLESGVYLPPSQFEACFVSAAHSKKYLDKTIEASYNSLKKAFAA